MAKRPLPDPETLRKLLRYDPGTGKLFWLARPREFFPDLRSFACWNSIYPGREALAFITDRGYRRGTLFCNPLQAHRAAWELYYGQWPEGEIDHINGVKSDNRIVNLRSASRLENAKNKGRQSNNTSGFKGVSLHTQTQKWTARIMVSKKSISLGLFDDPESAYAAYCRANIKFHGEFGRLG